MLTRHHMTTNPLARPGCHHYYANIPAKFYIITQQTSGTDSLPLALVCCTTHRRLRGKPRASNTRFMVPISKLAWRMEKWICHIRKHEVIPAREELTPSASLVKWQPIIITQLHPWGNGFQALIRLGQPLVNWNWHGNQKNTNKNKMMHEYAKYAFF